MTAAVLEVRRAGEVLARFPALGVGALAAFGVLRREQEARCFLVDGAGELPVPAGSLLITRTSLLRCAEES